MACIDINNLTKDFGQGRGIFDISLSIEQGEVFGFAGVNGAGKTTTIRNLMGFIKPDSGNATINGIDCTKKSAQVKQKVAYIPGEINFPGNDSGEVFLKRQMEMLGRGNWEHCKKICDKLQLDATANIKSMSKGMKQKTAIAAAFAAESDILIMDEPTTGLDPLMRDTFIELLEEQKAMGKTIFMSSHIFKEMEETCDRVALINKGKIIDLVQMDDIRYNKNKRFKIEFKNQESFDRFSELSYQTENVQPEDLQLTVVINDKNINDLMNDLKNYDVAFFKEIKQTFEDYFNQTFKEEA
ncbi:ATP-binding cassette domain-containing protein [Ligilactobacillus pobuzihii]|uniref:ABC transporter ATP-binding protein n=1 Tax=Ligilactobacillus pobuzihii TaxID=449659 RepID=UPI0019D10BB1|nr:ATP-binding cassette domain-containing protein [Ligilactobacillus pobuzihii]MBN7273907.1 ATP-binding cassette domain-containing protein [Ligilactobacillus pobuzihii]